MGFIFLLLVVLIFWLLWGRGAWIVYKHKDESIVLPADSTKEGIMDILKKELTYPFLKEIYYDEHGNIAIVGKYDTYPLFINDGRLYLSPQKSDSGVSNSNKTVSALEKIGILSLKYSKENRKKTEEIECLFTYILKIFDHSAPVDARKKSLKMKKAAKNRRIVIAFLITLCVLLFVCALNNSGLLGGNANNIKNSYLTQYSSTITIGDAFEDFFSSGKWKNYEEGIQEYVDFSGVCYYDGEEVTVVITFLINEDSFVIDSITKNGRELYPIEEYALLEAIYS